MRFFNFLSLAVAGLSLVTSQIIPTADVTVEKDVVVIGGGSSGLVFSSILKLVMINANLLTESTPR